MALDKTSFIRRTQAVAENFVAAVNEVYALTELLGPGGFGDQPADGGLDTPDFTGTPLDRDKVLAFFQTMGALLAPLTTERKRTIYDVAR